MKFSHGRIRALGTVVLLFAAATWLAAQESGAKDDLPGVDLNGLTAAQKQSASKLLQKQGCSCGCEMKVAECRIKDPSCSYSQGLADVIVSTLKKGGSEQQAAQAAGDSKYAHGPRSSGKLLDDPVTIAVDGAPVLGPANARLTLVEFSDFQCPYCVAATPELEAIVKQYPTQLKLIFKQYPLEIHSRAAFAAAASLAAQKQRKFWQMHDALFQNHRDLSDQNVMSIAKDLGLDMQQFQRDLHSPAVEQRLQKDITDGDHAGVEGTPTLYIDGQRFNGPLTVETLKPVLDQLLKSKPGENKAASL